MVIGTINAFLDWPSVLVNSCVSIDSIPIDSDRYYTLFGQRPQRSLRPGPPGQGPQARALRPGPPGQGSQARASKPGAPSQGLQVRAPRPDPPGQTDGWTNGWTDGPTDVGTDGPTDVGTDRRTEKISPAFFRISSLWGRCLAYNWKI